MKPKYTIIHDYNDTEIIESNFPSYRLAKLRAKLGEKEGAEVVIELQDIGVVYTTEDGDL